jgi:hypothetical protein
MNKFKSQGDLEIFLRFHNPRRYPEYEYLLKYLSKKRREQFEGQE